MPSVMRPAVVLLAVALLPLTPLTVRADPFLIVPGRSIGQTHLGRNGVAYLKRLPPPDGKDAAMGGQRWLVWKSKTSRDTLAIYGHSREFEDPPEAGMRIDEIRATSPRFHTRSGLHTGSMFSQIRAGFPKERSINGDGTIYASARQGITFEFARRPSARTRCIAITVYLPGPSNMFMDAAQVRDILRIIPRKQFFHA